jgi:DNA-binding NtrC family response regulator
MLTVLPLRERKDAIPRLAETFLASAMPPGRTPPRISASAISALVAHDWPGNVRELRTVMERAAVLCEGEELRPQHLLLDRAPASEPPARSALASASVSAPASLAEGGDDHERQRILDALEACAGNQTRAAKMLGISRTTLVHKLAVHRIPRPRTSLR